MPKYDHQSVERRWQSEWEKHKAFRAPEMPEAQKKRYVLDMFPYPSSAGLHVGHPEGYTATDILSRYLRLRGFEVLHPMGWDAFGLPAENFAIKSGKNPRETTDASIKNFKRQIQSLGFSYDWSREVNTSDPAYYKWTQWLFEVLHRAGLVYKKKAPVNWCPKDQTVLANEQVVDGACERCGTAVVQKELAQWFFRVTAYADELLSSLDSLDWPEPIKHMQRNWIGRSEGAEIEFKIQNSELKINVFTTRPDTLFGVTYVVLAPEHVLVSQLTTVEHKNDVEKYVESARTLKEIERTSTDREKTGVFTGSYALNPANNERVPIWIADYVLASYGTGAVMAVPAHDERDFQFAKKFKLPMRQVISPENILIYSAAYNGMQAEVAAKKIVDDLSARGSAKQTVQYKLRDWLISRQRYWGAPIPVVVCEEHGEQLVPEKDLPVKLPDDVDFKPTGESPLAASEQFAKGVTCPVCGKKAKRETDTMDTFVDSSWYFLRYCDPKNSKQAFDHKKIAAWLPTDVYVGGAEHAVLHLLYSRFIYKALADAGELPANVGREPFTKLRNQGLILGEDGEKMSKSRGNVVNPDDVVAEYGADALRLYEMFLGPLEMVKPWSTKGIVGMTRFLDRVWQIAHREQQKETKAPTQLLHQTIKKVSEDIENFRFNTAIAQLMVLSNAFLECEGVDREAFGTFLHLLLPFAPHLASECLDYLKFPVEKNTWPEFDPSLVVEASVEITVQVNGKRRATLTMPRGTNQEEATKAALADANTRKFVTGEPKKVIFVADKIINFVV